MADAAAGAKPPEPYAAGLVPDDPFVDKADVEGTLVAVLGVVLHHRGLRLEAFRTRAFAAGSVHELLLTDERRTPGGTVQEAAYLGFAQLAGGVVAVGDALEVRGRRVGRVTGFNATHAPNHWDIVIAAPELRHGGALGLRVGDEVRFRYAAGARPG